MWLLFCNLIHPMFFFILNEFFFNSVICKQKRKKLKNVPLTEDLETQAVGVKLPAEESSQVNNQEENCKTGFGAEGEELSKTPKVSNQEEDCKTGAEAAVKQLTVEEKNISQVRWETYGDDTSDDEDPTPAAEEGPTQENKLQYMKIDEVSWTKAEG